MKKRPLILAAGFILALWLALFADKTPSAAIAEAVPRSPNKVQSIEGSVTPARNANAASSAQEQGKPLAPDVEILTLRERADLIGEVKGHDPIFVSQNWTPPPPPPPPAAPSPPPTAPALPFSFIGKKYEDNKWEIYLAQGDQTYVVHEDMLIAGLYRVEKIQPPTLTLTYIPLNQIQTLSIGGAD